MFFRNNMKSLRTKTLIFSISSIFIIIFTGITLFILYEKETRELLLHRDKGLARTTALRLSERLTRYHYHLQKIAADINLQNDSTADLKLKLDEFNKYAYIFDGGAVIYDKDWNPLLSLPAEITKNEINFTAGRLFDKTTSLHKPAISNIVKVPYRDEKVLVFTVPILSYDDKINGFLTGRALLKYSILEADLANVLGNKLGETGFAYLVDGSGFVIHHPKNSLTTMNISESFPEKIMHEEYGATFAKSLSGNSIICGFSKVPGSEWKVITQENWGEIIGPMRKYGILFSTIIICIVALVIIFVFWGINRVLYPIKKLALGAQQIARGVFDSKIILDTGDEIQELSEQFNIMAASLKTSYLQLENQIDNHRKSHSLLTSVIESPANIIIFSIDSNYRYTAFNQNHKNEIFELYGIEINTGMNILDILDEQYLKFSTNILQRVFKGEQITFTKESRMQEQTVFYEFFVNPTYTKTGTIIGITAFAVDRTQRMETEKQLLIYQEKLRSLSNELLLAEELERRRIALDLHERIGHSFANVTIRLSALRERLTSDKSKQLLKEANDLVSQSIRDMRTLTFEISPPILYDLGLEAGVEWLIEETHKDHGLQINFEFNLDWNSKLMDPGFSILLFRAIRELLFNIVKHADATNVSVSIANENEDIRILIKDNGVGFEAADNVTQIGNNDWGFGLFSIRERLSHLGGYLDVDSTPGKGTIIMMVAPIKWKKL